MQARCGQSPCCCEASTSGRAPSATAHLAQWRQLTIHVQRSLNRVGGHSALSVASASVQHTHDVTETATLSASDSRGFERGRVTGTGVADARLAGLHAADYEKALSSAAMARAKAGDMQGALRDLRDLARRFPWNCRIPVSAATLEVRRRNYNAARELFKLAVMAGRPDNDHIPVKAWGMMEARLGNTEKARALYKEAVEMYPRDKEVLHAWGSLERKSGDFAAARQLYQRALELEPTDAYNVQCLASLEGLEGNREEARRLFAQGVEQSPQHVTMWQEWARLEWAWGSPPTARKIFRAAREACAPDAELLAVWAKLEAEQRHADVDLARSLYHESLAVNGRRAQTLLGLGMLEAREGNTTKAMEIFLKGLQLERGSVQFLTCIAQLHVKLGALEEARRMLAQVLDKQPDNAHALHTLGNLEILDGNHNAAGSLFRRGLQYRDIKGSMLCYEALARLHEFNLNIDQARATFQEASKRCRGPAGFRVLSRLLCEFASFEKRQNNLKAASELFRASLEVNSTDSSTFMLAGLLERRRKDWEAARELFRKGVALTKENASLFQAWAWTEKEAGDLAAARKVLEMGCEQCPENVQLILERALLEVEAGSTEAARELFQLGARPGLPPHAPLLEAWTSFERAEGNVDLAESLCKQHGLTVL